MSNYSGTIVSHALAQSKSGTPSVKLLINATKDLDSGSTVDQTFYADLWLTDKTAERSMTTLRELGYQSDTLDAINYGKELVGTPCEIVTEIDSYEGKSTEKVKYVNRAGSYAERGIKSVGKTEAADICSKYDALLRATQKRKAAAKAAPGPVTASYQSQTTNADDDLPF